MESQRVKLLTEGYLRGWLTFEYANEYSRTREEIIINHIFEERLSSLLKNRLFVDTSIKSALLVNGKADLSSIDNISSHIIDLKLPSLKSKDKIKKENDTKKGTQLTQEDIALFKQELAELQKINKNKK